MVVEFSPRVQFQVQCGSVQFSPAVMIRVVQSVCFNRTGPCDAREGRLHTYPIRCMQVDGCYRDLHRAKEYFRRCRCCAYHSKQPQARAFALPLRACRTDALVIGNWGEFCFYIHVSLQPTEACNRPRYHKPLMVA